MSKEDSIKRMLLELRQYNIETTKQFLDDISGLVLTNVDRFVKTFFKDFARKNFDDYNRFEPLGVDRKDKPKLKGYRMLRYEYRYSSNLKCIFIVKKVNNNEVILLCAFNEDGDKQKGNDSYKTNIKRAIRIFERIY